MTDVDYSQPQEVSDPLHAFPAVLGDLLPPREVIPRDYPHRRDWQRFQAEWFAGRLPADVQMHAVSGVDARVAGRHLEAIQGSFEPKHEHKADAVAWLASLWFREITTVDGTVMFPRP